MSLKTILLIIILIPLVIYIGKIGGNYIALNFISKDNIEVKEEKNEEVKEEVKPDTVVVLKVTQKKTKLRAGWGGNFAIIKELKVGTYLEPINYYNRWYRVKTEKGIIGWVNRKVVESTVIDRVEFEKYFSNFDFEKFLKVRLKEINNELSDTFINLVNLSDYKKIYFSNSVNSRIISKAFKYDVMYLICYRDKMCKVTTFYGTKGWVSDDEIKLIYKNLDNEIEFLELNEENLKRIKNKIGKTKEQNINVREDHNIETKTIIYLPKNINILVLSYFEGWYQIFYNNVIGWCDEKKIEVK
ncbi:MAG TPA: hypothetical protein PLD27_00280 [bacterium]|nr:hypothetical protein [bacterium]HOL47380.1 hypothetical protein [bacterium]HPQ18121.1 hypothetical protein [bacterium]